MTSGVDLEERVRLGGLEQYVHVRGNDAGNPLLLILHGGPGFAEGPLFKAHNAELEQHFLVAHWDQRGAGRSYAPDLPTESMTLRQFVEDAVELIDWLTARFGQRKVYLAGHSWGSIVGATVASEHPARLHAYLSVCQAVAGLSNEQTSFAYTLRKAIETGDDKAVEQLRAIEHHYVEGVGLTYEALVTQRRLLGEYGGAIHGDGDAIFSAVDPDERAFYFGDLNEKAQEFSLTAVLPELLTIDLARTARTFDVPVHFFVGRHDQNTPAELAVAYYEAVEAPRKQLHWFEESAHLLPFEEAAKFNALVTATLT